MLKSLERMSPRGLLDLKGAVTGLLDNPAFDEVWSDIVREKIYIAREGTQQANILSDMKHAEALLRCQGAANSLIDAKGLFGMLARIDKAIEEKKKT